MSHPVIGSKYDGPPLDRPCLRKMPEGWYLDEPKKESAFPPILAIILGVLFACMIVAQLK